MKNSILSVIIPNYGDFRIENLLKYFSKENSLYLNQTDIIIVEGNTKNPCKEIYEKYNNIIKTLIIEKDQGIFDALNKGIKKSKADYILLMGSDDGFSKSGFLDLFFESYDQSEIYGIDCEFIDDYGKIKRYWKNLNVSKKRIERGILPPHFSIVVHKNIYKTLGLFEIELGKLGLDSIWLYNLSSIDFNYKFLGSEVRTQMSLGGASTGSIRNIFIGNIILFNYLKSKKSFFIALSFIFVKIFSKLFQINFFLKPKLIR